MKNKFDTIQGVKLLSDAGNTYNQTQLTPSEILSQRNELLDELRRLIPILSGSWKVINREHVYLHFKELTTIKNHN